MRTTKQIQKDIDEMAKLREYWRAVLDSLTAPKTKPLMDGLKHRVLKKKSSYVDRYDKCDPSDGIEIARCQEARKICDDFLKELDADIAINMINVLDEKLKSVNSELGAAKNVSTDINIYSKL